MPEWVQLWRKTGQRGLLIASYKRLKTDSDRARTPAVEAVHVSSHLALPEFPQPKQLHHLLTQPSLGQTQARQGSLRSKPQWTAHMQRWE